MFRDRELVKGDCMLLGLISLKAISVSDGELMAACTAVHAEQFLARTTPMPRSLGWPSVLVFVLPPYLRDFLTSSPSFSRLLRS